MSDLEKPEQIPLEVEKQIDALCIEFERELREQAPPRIEDYLARVEKPLQGFALGELLALELHLLPQRGTIPDRSDYLKRFPGHGDVVRAAFHKVLTRSSDDAPQPPNDAEAPVPEQIGRYEIRRILGEGGFGRVYLAHDPALNREVALKAPNQRLFDSGVSVEAFAQEARHAAALKHLGIVAVYDVQQDGQQPFIVQEYIDGRNLDEWAKEQPPTHQAIVGLLIEIAEAVGCAHQQGLIHRDLKPANILVDQKGRAHVADFGLAVDESAQRERKGEICGTPHYMSPEQVRGETHRLDGRTDLWSLGVILYELLVGSRPFGGAGRTELFDEIANRQPRPLRQRDPTVPQELERICLKCLEKRANDRYASTADLIDDLRYWQTATQHDSPKPSPAGSALNDSPLPTSPKIIPKGLRSFDEGDADFFLELLPGPRDREGLPESIRFWKRRIEETDADKTFSVGLIYGPSGCGKSSLVKAGLLPRLAAHVLPVYVEATPTDTEARLLKELNKRLSETSTEHSLPDVFRHLREQGIGGKKVLIVLDQFEQWLHVPREDDTELLEALRQCDGQHLQCLVMVRDDFWMAVTSFFRDLEIRIVDGENTACIPLFIPRHARKVLSEFGRAYGCLPDNLAELSTEQEAFLGQSVAELSEDDKTTPVRLALFAQMLQGKPWAPETLKQIGGVSGVGVTFLEESFSAPSASPEHRRHQKAARSVLRKLLPESEWNIKVHMRSRSELLEASGYATKPDDFDELLRILDQEVRLITPTEERMKAEGGRMNEDEDVDQIDASFIPHPSSFYQLTHDYLVPSLREWLTRKQKETHCGRAELRLAERSATWSAKPENRHLPSSWEYANIRFFTNKKTWSEPQIRMMKKAGRIHGLRWGSALLVALLIGLSLEQIVQRNLLQRTKTAVAAMSTSREILVPRAIADLEELPREMVLAELRKQFDTDDESRKLSLAYALAHYGDMKADFLVSQVKETSPDEVSNLVTALSESRDEAIAAFQTAARGAQSEKDWRHKARLAILALHLKHFSSAREMCQLQPDPIQRTLFIEECSVWHGDLVALSQHVTECQDGLLRSAIVLGVGSVAVEELTSPEKQTWEKVLSSWFRHKTDATTHSAAGWALRKWKLAPPKIEQSKQPAQGYDWHVNSVGMTMLRMPAGRFERNLDPYKSTSLKQQVTISRSFLISDREVSRRQFQRFVDDPDYPAKEKPKDWTGASETHSPTEDHPVQQVNWYDAILFCNWLSHKEGLKPCYERTGEKEKSMVSDMVEHDAWRLIPEADGYRLPTEAQWEYAWRAGTTTEFSFGNDESLLDRYAVYRTSRTETQGSKLPNGWGVFDMHGNLWEWCHDWHGRFFNEPSVVDPTGPSQGHARVLRGGSFDLTSSVLSLRSVLRTFGHPDERDMINGFRVARTYH